MPNTFLIVGSPAVGKSSTARALAARSVRSLHIPVDDLRNMVIAGAVHPSAEWSSALAEQLQLARASAIHMANAYGAAGFDVVIDDFWDPTTQMQEYVGLEHLSGVIKILLYPSQAAAQARNRMRSGDETGSPYIAEGIRIIYQFLAPVIDGLPERGWHILDTTDMSIEQTVDAIIAIRSDVT